MKVDKCHKQVLVAALGAAGSSRVPNLNEFARKNRG